MKKLTFLVFATIATLSSNACAQQNQLSKNSTEAEESIRESGCLGRQSDCDPSPSTQLNQTEPLATHYLPHQVTGVDANQWRANPEGLTSTQPSPWQFPINRWATNLGNVFGKLNSYSSQTTLIETVETQPKTTPQLSTFDLAEELELASPRPTSQLLLQETVELNQVETESSFGRVASQQQIDGTSEYFRSRRSELSLGTLSTPITPAVGPI